MDDIPAYIRAQLPADTVHVCIFCPDNNELAIGPNGFPGPLIRSFVPILKGEEIFYTPFIRMADATILKPPHTLIPHANLNVSKTELPDKTPTPRNR